MRGVLATFALIASSAIAADAPRSCPVTQPQAQPFVPPAPYKPVPAYNRFYLGSDKLWTELPRDGVWGQLPRIQSGYSQKLVWWREGLDWRDWIHEPTAGLVVTSKRLDDPDAKTYTWTRANVSFIQNESFIVSGVALPTAGCWQITGDLKGEKLTFVVWVLT